MKSLLARAALILCLIGSLSCERPRELAGNYGAESPGSPAGGGAQVALVLKNDGKGAWKLGRDETSFTWERKGDELWLHSRTGGVIVGRLGKDDSIEISLPGMDSFHFKKTER